MLAQLSHTSHFVSFQLHLGLQRRRPAAGPSRENKHASESPSPYLSDDSSRHVLLSRIPPFIPSQIMTTSSAPPRHLLTRLGACYNPGHPSAFGASPSMITTQESPLVGNCEMPYLMLDGADAGKPTSHKGARRIHAVFAKEKPHHLPYPPKSILTTQVDSRIRPLNALGDRWYGDGNCARCFSASTQLLVEPISR